MSEAATRPLFRLVRVDEQNWGTSGVLVAPHPAGAFAVTLELVWRMNEKRVSRIPAGRYVCKRVKSPKFGNTFEVTGVPGRGSILFHWGNATTDSLGCILLGHGFDPVKAASGTTYGIVASKKEFAEFLKVTEDLMEFDLDVIDPPAKAA